MLLVVLSVVLVWLVRSVVFCIVCRNASGGHDSDTTTARLYVVLVLYGFVSRHVSLFPCCLFLPHFILLLPAVRVAMADA